MAGSLISGTLWPGPPAVSAQPVKEVWVCLVQQCKRTGASAATSCSSHVTIFTLSAVVALGRSSEVSAAAPVLARPRRSSSPAVVLKTEAPRWRRRASRRMGFFPHRYFGRRGRARH
ncbi:hypothetical protein HPB50_014484 [Hyalomma asiaticum]|uniref:Uncharacterized protein n=1 Tax=Hyalomma asiaticum TaxID=266040 RepID=A0ACB7SFI2_HYAAI|nr:hypothetical protein HPB50_014484 [Hyalomma asiaticum]